MCNNVVTRFSILLDLVQLYLFFQIKCHKRLSDAYKHHKHSTRHPQNGTFLGESLYGNVVRSKDGLDQQKLSFDAFKCKAYFNFHLSGWTGDQGRLSGKKCFSTIFCQN